MTSIDVEVDVTAAVGMVERIISNAQVSREVGMAIGRAADQGAQLVSGVPVGETGNLARSVRAFGGRIIATARNEAGVPYGRFVFGGTRHMAAQTPSVPADQIAQILADEVARVVFR